MGYAVYHCEKGKGSGAGIGNHIDREKGKEHSYRNADSSRTHLNVNYAITGDFHKMPLEKAIERKIEENYKGKRKIRNDAVKYIKHVLTGSHEDMVKISSDPTLFNKWIKKNTEFIKQEFGRENTVRFVVHMDEKTPHIHVITIPLTPDGRLSAKEVIGNRKDMQARQDRYAEMMKEFGLQRGVKNTGIKHENAREYYGRINEIEKKVERIIRRGVKVTELRQENRELRSFVKQKLLNIENQKRKGRRL